MYTYNIYIFLISAIPNYCPDVPTHSNSTTFLDRLALPHQVCTLLFTLNKQISNNYNNANKGSVEFQDINKE